MTVALHIAFLDVYYLPEWCTYIAVWLMPCETAAVLKICYRIFIVKILDPNKWKSVVSVRHAAFCQLFQIFLGNRSLLKNLSFSPIAPRQARGSVGGCLRVWSIESLLSVYTFKEFVSA